MRRSTSHPKKLCATALGLLLAICLPLYAQQPPQSAADITIDGSFDDWAGLTPFLDADDDANPEKGDLRTAWFGIGPTGETLFARLDVDACLNGGQTTAFDILLDTSGDGAYEYRVEFEIRGDGTVPRKNLFLNDPLDADPDNDEPLSYNGDAATAQVPENGCDQATEWSIPLTDLGSPQVVTLTRFETHPSGPGQAVADLFPNYGVIQADVSSGSFSHVGLVINEVFPTATPGAQWVELHNGSDLPVSLLDFTLTDHDGTGNSNLSLPDLVLPAGSYLVVHLTAGSDDLDLSDGVGHLFTGDPTPVYEAEDQVVLYVSSNQDPTALADLVTWDDDTTRSADFLADVANAVKAGLWPPEAAVDASGMDPLQTLGRSGDSLRLRLPSDWETSGGRDASDPTPGESNVGGVMINEVLADPIIGMEQGIELYNAGTGAVTLTGWMLSDQDPAGDGSGFSHVVPQVDGSDLVLTAGDRLWISLGPGTDTPTTLYANLSAAHPLDVSADQLALFFRNTVSAERIIDFVSWDVTSLHSSDWLLDDDEADDAEIWNLVVTEDYVEVGTLPAAHSLLRLSDGLDTDQSQDWGFSVGISDGDRDGDVDGLVDSRDNCPNDYNPNQNDQDGDGLGDACDGDLDGDGWVNSLDCSQDDPDVWSVPAEPVNFHFDTVTDFTCDTDPQAAEHHVYRGSRGGSDPFAYDHECFLTSTVGPDFTDGETPAAGSLFYYLVAASNGCGDSSLGSDSSGNPRPNGLSCP